MLGAIPSAAATALVRRLKQASPPPETGLPASSADWNAAGHVSPVRDQGACGSCVSFGCVGLIESMAHIKHDAWLDLSEADSHFCSSHGANCDGWWPDDCLDAASDRGIASEDQFPYATAFPNDDIFEDGPRCKLTHRPRTVTRAVRLRTRSTKRTAKVHLVNDGPLVGCFDVFTDLFNYKSGVYTHVSGAREGGHCVLVVGFSESEKCWIVKNSWGTDWGESGFGRISYSDFVLDGDFYPMYGIEDVMMPARVWLDRDAAVEHPNGKVYFFRGDRYQRYNFDLEQIDKDDARIGVDGWRGVWTTGIDAALNHPRNGKVYFFKGDRYQRFSFDRERVDRDNARIGIDGWHGVWSNGIDAALIHPKNGKAYFFKDDRYQRFDFDTERVDKDDARIGIDGWRGVWSSGIDAALVHPRNHKAYFFKGDRYQRFDFDADRVDKDNARVGVDGW
ncbi:hemopexin repeat-containing protein [Myxococcota bacterium]|nr:hemopexin repeat-containing protein [Myxococcota bacterium]